jgi:hypothetical protein
MEVLGNFDVLGARQRYAKRSSLIPVWRGTVRRGCLDESTRSHGSLGIPNHVMFALSAQPSSRVGCGERLELATSIASGVDAVVSVGGPNKRAAK